MKNKLNLKKETIQNLDLSKQSSVFGGSDNYTYLPPCEDSQGCGSGTGGSGGNFTAGPGFTCNNTRCHGCM